MKSSAIKSLFSKLQSFKLQPLALRVLKITEIPEIALKFFFAIADTNRFSALSRFLRRTGRSKCI